MGAGSAIGSIAGLARRTGAASDLSWDGRPRRQRGKQTGSGAGGDGRKMGAAVLLGGWDPSQVEFDTGDGSRGLARRTGSIAGRV